MPDLSFRIEGAEAVPHSATPLLTLKVRITANPSTMPIQNLLLQCQVQIEPSRRRYEPEEQQRLRDLFGEPSRWSQTLRSMLWTNATVVVPPFQGETVAEIPLPCTFDFTIATTKYFHGLEKGDIPVCALFSGTVFYAAEDGAWSVQKIPWDREANYRVPSQAWKEMMDLFYPNTAWLCLRRDIFDDLHQFKVSRGIPTWEEVFAKMMAAVEENDLRKVQV